MRLPTNALLAGCLLAATLGFAPTANGNDLIVDDVVNETLEFVDDTTHIRRDYRCAPVEGTVDLVCAYVEVFTDRETRATTNACGFAPIDGAMQVIKDIDNYYGPDVWAGFDDEKCIVKTGAYRGYDPRVAAHACWNLVCTPVAMAP